MSPVTGPATAGSSICTTASRSTLSSSSPAMPLAAAALILGVAELRPGALGGAAARALGLTVGLTAAGVAIGVGLVTLVQPGRGVDRAALPAGDSVAPLTVSPVDTFVNMVPDNVVGAASQSTAIAAREINLNPTGDMVIVLVHPPGCSPIAALAAWGWRW